LCVLEAAGVEFINGEQLAVRLVASVPCPQCGQATRIKLVEPHPVSEVEKHTFECQEYALLRTCGLRRTTEPHRNKCLRLGVTKTIDGYSAYSA
jgi:hypothetical protein